MTVKSLKLRSEQGFKVDKDKIKKLERITKHKIEKNIKSYEPIKSMEPRPLRKIGT
jgi:hypothetical protein